MPRGEGMVYIRGWGWGKGTGLICLHLSEHILKMAAYHFAVLFSVVVASYAA